MKKFIYLLLILGVAIFCDVQVFAQSNLTEPRKINFDKKRYDELVKKILRAKSPSFIIYMAKKMIKQGFYLGAASFVGLITSLNIESHGNNAADWAYFLMSAVLMYTVMQIIFDYLLVSKDQNLENLENFEKYVQKTVTSEDELIKKNAELIIKLFEKDYVLILNKIDQNRGPGIFLRIFRWIKKQIKFSCQATLMGIACVLLIENDADFTKKIGMGITSGVAYYLALIVIFDYLLAGKDQYLLKIEKLREIDQIFEEAKLKDVLIKEGVTSASAS